MEARGLASDRLSGQIAELVAASGHGRTDRPVHHVHIDPPPGCANPRGVIATYISAYEAEFGLQEGPRCGVLHTKAGRTHAHVVWSLVRENGRVIDLSHERARREKVSRIVEHTCGLSLVKGAHNRAVAQALRKEGRGDIADAMTAAGLLEGRRSIAAQVPAERAQAERTNIPIADVRREAIAAWHSADDGSAFAAALQERGLRLASGDRGPILIDRAGGSHSLTRTLSAAARIEGDRITAATVKRRIGGITLPMMEDYLDDRRARSPEERRRSHLPRSQEREADFGTAPAPVEPSRGTRGIGVSEAYPGPPDDDRCNPRAAQPEAGRDQGPHRTRWTESDQAAIAALRRADVAGIRAQAETIRLRPVRRAMRDRAVAHALSRMAIGSLLRDAQGILAPATAGGFLPHPESRGRKDSAMTIRGLGPFSSRKQDYKTRLIEGAVPGFNASSYIDDLHMIKAGGPSTPTRIFMRDRGWLEIDRKAAVVRTWGPIGRADVLAKQLAAVGGWDVERLPPSGEARRTGVKTPRPPSIPTNITENLVIWWRERGYDAVSAPDGAWVDAGGARLHDAGDHVELHGRLTPDAARALILKANEAWDGSAELSGPWSRPDQDMLWLEAQRVGVELHRCNPSDAARRAWDEELRATKAHDDTIGLVRAGSREAETLRAAANGDVTALGRLNPELRAFVSSFLDDEQRKELAEADPVDLIPELRRFRSLGADEIAMRRRQPDIQPPDKPGAHDFEQARREAQDSPKDDGPDASDLTM